MDYSPDQRRLLIEDVCRALADGASFRQACAEPHMPSRLTLRRWIQDSAEFQAMVRLAEAERATLLADELIAIVDGDGDPADKRVRMDARRWLAARMHPAKFGDKIAHTGDDGGPIKHAVTLDLSQMSDADLAAFAAETEQDGGKS